MIFPLYPPNKEKGEHNSRQHLSPLRYAGVPKYVKRITDLATLLGRDMSAFGKAAQRIAGYVNERRLVSELIDAMQTDCSKCPEL